VQLALQPIVLHHKDDKVRACAAFALRNHLDIKESDTKGYRTEILLRTLCAGWGGPFQPYPNRYNFADRNKSQKQLAAELKLREDTAAADAASMLPFGPLTKLATGKLYHLSVPARTFSMIVLTFLLSLSLIVFCLLTANILCHKTLNPPAEAIFFLISSLLVSLPHQSHLHRRLTIG